MIGKYSKIIYNRTIVSVDVITMILFILTGRRALSFLLISRVNFLSSSSFWVLLHVVITTRGDILHRPRGHPHNPWRGILKALLNGTATELLASLILSLLKNPILKNKSKPSCFPNMLFSSLSDT